MADSMDFPNGAEEEQDGPAAGQPIGDDGDQRRHPDQQ